VNFFMMHRQVPTVKHITVFASSHFGKNIEDEEISEFLSLSFECLRAMKEAHEEFHSTIMSPSSTLSLRNTCSSSLQDNMPLLLRGGQGEEEYSSPQRRPNEIENNKDDDDDDADIIAATGGLESLDKALHHHHYHHDLMEEHGDCKKCVGNGDTVKKCISSHLNSLRLLSNKEDNEYISVEEEKNEKNDDNLVEEEKECALESSSSLSLSSPVRLEDYLEDIIQEQEEIIDLGFSDKLQVNDDDDRTINYNPMERCVMHALFHTPKIFQLEGRSSTEDDHSSCSDIINGSSHAKEEEEKDTHLPLRDLVDKLLDLDLPEITLSTLAAWRANTPITEELDVSQETLLTLSEDLAQLGMTWAVLVLFHESRPGDSLWLLHWTNLLILSCAESHNLELGNELYEYISEGGLLEPDETTFTYLANLCSNVVRESRQGRNTILEEEDDDDDDNDDDYIQQDSLVKKLINSLWDHPIREDLSLTADFYAHIMLASIEDYEQCLRIYSTMQEEGVKPNEEVLQVLVESALRTGEIGFITQAMNDGEKLGVNVDLAPILETLRGEWEASDLITVVEDDDDFRPDGPNTAW